ncbi:MAG TPA: hypothetical protein VGV37_12970 [Aliidongia sp.]|uniref:alpha/beta hydrolase family protein n=1 Tax=Aliidongia sp. TaxID=1914230 RepID=UPI002DDD815D|nr:hypothetical protein [Aliidongia sp.]HEV2675448.1 hypothetical protein [Aliidongia sp.]
MRHNMAEFARTAARLPTRNGNSRLKSTARSRWHARCVCARAVQPRRASGPNQGAGSMRFPGPFLAVALCLAISAAHAAGVQFIEIPPISGGSALTGAVWYPCPIPPTAIKVGHITLAASKDCPVAGEKLPLVVISHGFGGKFTSHRDTAATLADAGFVVVAINHPVDSGPDMSRACTSAVLTERPRDIGRVIDYMSAAWPDRSRLDLDRIGFFGFSRGGYTGLVAIGGKPDPGTGFALCPSGERPGDIPPDAFLNDPRIKAAVIADPGYGPMFTPESLRDVSVPIQLWASQFSAEDRVGVTTEYVVSVGRNLPVKPDYHLVVDAGHFAFLTPCPAELIASLPKLCADRPGFDRVAFHRDFDAAVLAFFRERLPGRVTSD